MMIVAGAEFREFAPENLRVCQVGNDIEFALLEDDCELGEEIMTRDVVAGLERSAPSRCPVIVTGMVMAAPIPPLLKRTSGDDLDPIASN